MKEECDLAGNVIEAAMKVHSKLRSGFLETVYQKALASELKRRDFDFELEKNIAVYYEEEIVGHFVADLFVENRLIVEIKAVQSLVKAHEAQLVNYLTATGMSEGLLLNFGSESLEFKKKFRARQKTTPSLINSVNLN